MTAAAVSQFDSVPSLEEATRELARIDYHEFILYTNPRYVPSIFSLHLSAVLQKFLEGCAAGKAPRLIITAPPRHGKALEVSTPIPTPDGWKAIGDLEAGDFVFDDSGAPTRIVAISETWRNRPVFRVETCRGFAVTADASHEWRVSLCRKSKGFRKYETKVIARPRGKRALVETAGPLQLPERDLPIPPYTLGVWLGDGCTHHATITHNALDRGHFVERIESEGVAVSQRATANTFGLLGISGKLRSAGLLHHEKRIPPEYLRGSEAQRLAILQGLVDTDGYVAPDGQIEFCSTSRPLADGVRELVSSMGIKSSLIEGRAVLRGKDCGPKYRVMFYSKRAASLPRKAKRCRDAKKQPGHYVTAEPAGRADTVCIEVESASHMFLAGEGMIPTCNSEQVSRRLPVYALGRWPDSSLIGTSYGFPLISRMSRDQKRIIDERSYHELFPETRIPARSGRGDTGGRKRTDEIYEVIDFLGNVVSAGVNGPIGGMGATLYGWIDDPIKDAKEAHSEVYKESIWEWYQSTFLPRIEDGAGVLLTTTRWDMGDLAGRLIKESESGEGEHFEVINYEAICETPASDPLGRKEGQPLDPKRWPKKTLLARKKGVGSYVWTALFQGSPSVKGGTIFKGDWWQYWSEAAPPRLVWRVITADTAQKKGERNDYSVFQCWGRGEDGKAYLLDQIRDKWESPELLRVAVDFWTKHTEYVKGGSICREMLIEDKSSGTGLIQQLEKGVQRHGETVRIPVRGIPRSGPGTDKVTRAHDGAPWIEGGHVVIPESAPWLSDYLQEWQAFSADDSHSFDDQVDAGLDAIAEILGGLGDLYEGAL